MRINSNFALNVEKTFHSSMIKDITIMYTDVVGYSKLTGDNQEVALEILAEHNKILFQNTKYYSGEIVKETGDGICALFNEPADAIKCAIDIQKDLYKRNQLNIKERQIQIRIGLNHGSCVIEEEDVFGDGINLAKEIESKAPHGGIGLSQALNDLVWDFNDIYIREYMTINFNNKKNNIYEVYPDLISWVKNEKNQLAQITDYNYSYKKAHDFFHIGDYSTAIKYGSLSLQNPNNKLHDEILSFICHTFLTIGEFEYSKKMIKQLNNKHDKNNEKQSHIFKMEGILNINKNNFKEAKINFENALEAMKISNKKYINELVFNICLIDIENNNITKDNKYIKLSNSNDEDYKVLVDGLILNNNSLQLDSYIARVNKITSLHLQSIAYYLIALFFRRNKDIDNAKKYIDLSQDLLVKSSENISDWFQRKSFLDNIILHKKIMNFSNQLSKDFMDLAFQELKSKKANTKQKKIIHQFCTNCGSKNEKKYQFCTSCGNKLYKN